MTKRFLIVGNDKFGNMALKANHKHDKVFIFVDHSTSLFRIFKLLKRGVISFPLISKIFYCESVRNGCKPDNSCPSIKCNNDLIKLIDEFRPDEVILYRAGLIINSAVLGMNSKILNIHCARLPDYGGIGTISRALKDKQFNQCATLHIVTKRIDEGEILFTEPYQLDPYSCYCKNENIAYSAGLSLLEKYLTN